MKTIFLQDYRKVFIKNLENLKKLKIFQFLIRNSFKKGYKNSPKKISQKSLAKNRTKKS